MSIRRRATLTAVLVLTTGLAGCQESSKLDDAAKARLAQEAVAAEDLKKSIGDEKYRKLAADGDEDGKELPPHAVFSQLERAKRSGSQSKRAR